MEWKAIPVGSGQLPAAIARLKGINSAEICARISRLDKADFSRLGIDQIHQRIGRLVDGYATKMLILQTNALFRARKLSADAEVTNIREIWYPPADLVQQGRFNRPKEPVFYASNRSDAALWEIRPQVGDRVLLAVCATIHALDEINVSHIGMGSYRGKGPAVGDVPVLAQHQDFLDQLKSASVDKKWLRIDGFLADLATSDEDNRPGLYNATGVIGDILLGIPKIDGLLYPSIATGFSAFNVRLSAQAADEKVFVSEIWDMEFVQHKPALGGMPPSKPGYGLMKTLRRSEAIGEDGSIEWAENFETDFAKDNKMVHQRIPKNRAQRYPDARLSVEPSLEKILVRRFGPGLI